METSNTVRPSDASKISFAPECFETIGTREEYVVVLAAPSYPRNFGTDKAAAESFARKTRRCVTVDTIPVTRRVRWI
jgi:hypothetical protein